MLDSWQILAADLEDEAGGEEQLDPAYLFSKVDRVGDFFQHYQMSEFCPILPAHSIGRVEEFLVEDLILLDVILVRAQELSGPGLGPGEDQEI